MASQKTIVITGANAGIGLATAKALAIKGYCIIIICRDARRGDDTAEQLKRINPNISVENFTADLSDLSVVKRTADAIAAKYPVIDRLINNAGYYPSTIEYIGDVEKTFFASHLGHMLLTERLLPALERSPEARIINVSSGVHPMGKVARFFKRVNGLTLLQAYADAKLANILFTMELSKRLPNQITTYALHPGVVRTNFAKGTPGLFTMLINIFRPFLITPEKGAATSIYLADAEPKKITSFTGQYFAKQKPTHTNNKDVTAKNATWLWHTSIEMLKPFLS